MKLRQNITKNYRFLVFLIIFTSLIFVPLAASLAKVNSEDSNIYLSSEQVFEEILFVAGANLDINAQVNDDVYAAGANIIISGPVSGDVIAVGSNIIINGDVKGNLRVAGGNVTIKGKIDKNVTVLAGMLTLAPEAEIGQSLIAGAGDMEISGKIYENLYGAGSNIDLNGDILGNAYLTIDPTGELVLYPETNIVGTLDYSAGQLADVRSGAKIQGEEKYSEIEKQQKPMTGIPGMKNILLVIWFVVLISTVVVGLVIIYLFKDFALEIKKVLDNNILKLLIKGLIVLIITPLAIIFLAVTIIGLPLALILSAFYLIAMYISRIFVAIYLGEKLIGFINTKMSKKISENLLWPMVLGLVLIFILCALPFVGWLFKLIFLLWGLGALGLVIKTKLKLDI